jgi:hypothetical protein
MALLPSSVQPELFLYEHAKRSLESFREEQQDVSAWFANAQSLFSILMQENDIKIK